MGILHLHMHSFYWIRRLDLFFLEHFFSIILTLQTVQLSKKILSHKHKLFYLALLYFQLCLIFLIIFQLLESTADPHHPRPLTNLYHP